MATLVSPGVSISVIDQSINVGAGPGTVPLIFIATQQDKPTPDGAEIAQGTTKANAGIVWSITSQRDLVQTFGDPIFYSVSGTSLNGYPLNEYGLLAAYSYLGSSNLARIVRADIDTAGLEPTPIQPSSPAAVGTYWFDESSNGSSFGLFKRFGTAPNESWIAVDIDPRYIYDFKTPGNTPPSTDGVNGDVAVIFESPTSTITYWLKTTNIWLQLGSAGTPAAQVVVDSVWPDLALNTQPFWIKTSSAAQGANFVLRRMDATIGAFVQVEAPILPNDATANTYYDNNPAGSAGQVYVEPIISGTASSLNAFEFRMSTGLTGPWDILANVVGVERVVGSITVPTSGPANGQLWFNAEVGVNGKGQSTVDILVADGAGSWQNINLEGFDNTVLPGSPTLFAQSGDPRDNTPAPVLLANDVWVDTDVTPYPHISYWNGTAWVLVNNEDQHSNHGILFTDARPNPMYHDGVYAGENNGGGTNPDLDPDAPDSDLYPKGFMLWNTRYSTNVVKEWQEPYIFDGVTAAPDDTNNDSTGRWATVSGNDAAGDPYMGSNAQKIVIVRAIQSAIVSNEDIRAEDLFFNLIAAPGYVEAVDEMLSLNDDRKDTGFVLCDTPFTLAANGTALQNWATNHANALGNGDDGLVSASKYFSAWYPSGLATNVDGTDVVVPPTHMALRTIAYSDQVAYPWFAPAGLQRGVVNNAAAVGYVNDSGQFVTVKLNEGQRDILYINGINPIRVMPSGGIVVFGQKTRQPYASATDRINVVRLENYLRYQLNLLALPFLFEPNDTVTRKAVKDAFDRFMAELITLRALYDFLVVCDLSNNTPARIDRNELWIDIAIQPVKAIEFIYIPIRILNTGASLALP
jgi:Phage tail sheath C-terminal domain